MVTFVWKLQPRAGQFFAGKNRGGECADFALRGKHVVGRALWARTYALLSKRLLFLNIFIGFSAETLILQ